MNGIFLHTSWRSSGTWLWERLRSQPEYMGFYEPLHEALPSLSLRRIALCRTSNWQSRHTEMTRPYFAEYAPLLKTSKIFQFRRGVALAEPSFSFDRFFMEKDERHEKLYFYIKQLCDTARMAGKQPVLKFARSQGRFSWLAAHFPDYTHALLIRQPWTQFRSGWRCMVEGENPYFVAVPFLLLERNIATPDVAALVQALDLPVRPSFGPPIRTLKYWVSMARRIDAITLYKASFALWLLNIAHALPEAALVLDGDGPLAEMLAPFGLEAGARQRPHPGTFNLRPLMNVAAIRSCHDKAVAALAYRLDPILKNRLEYWLSAAEAQAARDLAVHVQMRALAPVTGFLHRAADAVR